jgi:hypothetical protein
MKIFTRCITTALLTALTASVLAAQTVIPKDTVIPVTLDKSLSSATSRVGDTFYAHHEGINGGGFPEHTMFTGRVQSVTRASGNTPGQIGVGFVSAKLPDGTRMPINGQLASLDESSVRTDPDTGRLVGTSSARKGNLKFVAYGAGAGLVIGQIAGKRAFLGSVLGAAAGYLYGQKQVKPAIGKDVRVSAGTGFGILLNQEVALADTTPVAVGGVTAGLDPGLGWKVTFDNMQPFMSGNDLMVPLKYVMHSIDMPFDYNSTTRTIRADMSSDAQALHVVGTRTVDINGRSIRMDTTSQVVNGSIYVPSSFVELVTGRSAYWNQRSGVLRIE